MSAGSNDPQQDRPPWSDEDLLELLLGGDEVGLQRARADADAAERLRDLEGFLGRWREPLVRAPASLPAAAQQRLAQRVLARTTRQDTSWRGDVGIVLRFVGDRLGASPLLRVAAAVLLLQVLALPVLAWIVWSEPIRERITRIRLETEKVEPFLPAQPEAPLDELFVETPRLSTQTLQAELRPARIAPQPGALEIERALGTAARSLRTSDWPAPDQAGAWESTPALLLLDARARLASEGADALAALPAELLAPARAGVGGADGGLERALRAELLLDVLALTGREPEGLAAAVRALGSDARDPAPVRRLEALAIERARACGRADATAWSRLVGAGAAPGSRSADPLDGSWRAALRAALASDGAGGAALRAEDLSRWLGTR